MSRAVVPCRGSLTGVLCRDMLQFLMKRRLVSIIGAVLLAGAGAYCLSRTSPATDNIKPDYSPNRTIKDAGASVTVNFGQCTPDQRRIDVGFGSTFIVITGTRDDKTCFVKYNTQLEYANRTGGTFVGCAVPKTVGLMTFPKTPNGIDLRPIQQYCTK